jgi:Lrp/AsnC family leucine-responsive transcriptional regulator
MLDKTDRKIIGILQENSRLSNAALAEKVGLKASTLYERVKKLERNGYIKGYKALVDPDLLGKPILAFVKLIVGYTADFFESKQTVAEVCNLEPDVLECHSLAGEDDYLLKVRVANTKELEKLIGRIRSNAPVANSVSTIVLSSFKDTIAIQPFVEEETT